MHLDLALMRVIRLPFLKVQYMIDYAFYSESLSIDLEPITLPGNVSHFDGCLSAVWKGETDRTHAARVSTKRIL